MLLDRVIVGLLAFALAFFPPLASAQSPISAFPPGTFSNKAALDPAPVSGFQGPGDIVSGAVGFWSCARAYNAAYANGTNPLCDLKDKTTGTVSICTLRVATNGFADLSGSYCTGSTTPAVACAAAAGGACAISKAYDQTGHSNDATNATAAQMPALTFSALNSCPGMTFTSASTSRLNITAVTAAQPFSMTGLAIRTANFTTLQGILSSNGTTIDLEFSTTTNNARIEAPSVIAATVSNSAFHALIGVFNNASSSFVVDGAATTGTVGTNAFSAQAARIGRDSAGASLDGSVIEAGLWPSGFNATQYGNMNTNMHSPTSGCGSF